MCSAESLPQLQLGPTWRVPGTPEQCDSVAQRAGVAQMEVQTNGSAARCSLTNCVRGAAGRAGAARWP